MYFGASFVKYSAFVVCIYRDTIMAFYVLEGDSMGYHTQSQQRYIAQVISYFLRHPKDRLTPGGLAEQLNWPLADVLQFRIPAGRDRKIGLDEVRRLEAQAHAELSRARPLALAHASVYWPC
jgi:hypothetical protein